MWFIFNPIIALSDCICVSALYRHIAECVCVCLLFLQTIHDFWILYTNPTQGQGKEWCKTRRGEAWRGPPRVVVVVILHLHVVWLRLMCWNIHSFHSYSFIFGTNCTHLLFDCFNIILLFTNLIIISNTNILNLRENTISYSEIEKFRIHKFQ